jgi:hypothetical protein
MIGSAKSTLMGPIAWCVEEMVFIGVELDKDYLNKLCIPT